MIKCMNTKFEILDDITWADVAFRAYGNDLDELFFSSATALLSVLLENPGSVGSDVEKKIESENSDIEILLYEFLQEFIFFKDSEFLLLKPQSVIVSRTQGKYRLQCRLSGEYIDREKHAFNVDIKAVTLYKFSVICENGIWSATVVLDV